jgi:hypothetical protein
MNPTESDLIDFEELIYSFVNSSILTRLEELESIIPLDAVDKNWEGLLIKKVLLEVPGVSRDSKEHELWLKKAKEDESVNLISYWNGLRVIAFQAMKNWKILKVNDEIRKYKITQDRDSLVHGELLTNLDEEGKIEEGSWTDKIVDPVSLDSDIPVLRKRTPGEISMNDLIQKSRQTFFYGSIKADFEGFYEYVCARMCGMTERQIARNEELMWSSKNGHKVKQLRFL